MHLIPNVRDTAINISVEDQCAVGPDESGVDGEERGCVAIIVDLVGTDAPSTNLVHRGHVDSSPHLSIPCCETLVCVIDAVTVELSKYFLSMWSAIQLSGPVYSPVLFTSRSLRGFLRASEIVSSE